MAGPWEKYQQQGSGKPWEKYGAPPPSSIDDDKPQGGAVSRFLSRATGGISDEIAAHPNRTLNPFSREYWQAAKDNANQPVKAPSLRQMIPFGQTSKDISDKNYAGALGDVAPGAIQLGMALGGGKGAGEWVDPPPSSGIDALSEAAAAPAVEAARPAQAIEESDIEEARRRGMPREGSYEPEPARYALGPGQVPPDVVGQPNPNVLAGNQGIIVRKPLALPPARLARPMSADAIDDMGVNQEMMQRANAEDRGDINADWNENKNAAVPKWKQVAQIRAQLAAEAVMKEAEAAQAIPARLTRTPKPSARAPLAKPQPELSATPDDQLLPQLEESVRMARAKKQQK